MVELERVDRPGRHPVWREVHPGCPHCHHARAPGRQAIGWLSCSCENVGGLGGGGHRTLFCRDCGFEVFMPPHVAEHDQPART